MTRPLPSHGVPALWSRDMAADMARVQREEAGEAAFDAETARLIEERREETERALIAVRWAGAPVLDMPEDEEPGDDAGEEDDALAGLAMLLLALALGLLALASAAWIGWALAAHVGELWQAAEAAVERGAM